MNYKEIMNSEYYYATYSRIAEIKKDYPVDHAFLHIRHVVTYAKKLAKIFKLSNHQRKLLYIACALHDIGYLDGRENHAKSGSERAEIYLTKLNKLPKKDIEVIVSAIANHGGKEVLDFSEPVSMCLAIADKLDFVGSRYKNTNPKYDCSNYKKIVKNEFVLKDNKIQLTIFIKNGFNIEEFNTSHFGIKLKKFLDLLSLYLGIPNEIEFKIN